MTPLRQSMVDAMVTRGFAARTQESYVEAISKLWTSGHKIESTVRYLGIEVDDALEMAEDTEA